MAEYKTDNNRGQGYQSAAGTGQPSPGMRGFGGGGLRGGGGPRGMLSFEKPKNFKGTLARLWSYIGKERRLLLVVFLLIAASSAIGLTVPYLMGKGIDALSSGKWTVRFNILGFVAVTLVISYIIDASVSFFQGWLMAGISQKIVYGMRSTLYSKLHKLPVSFFDFRTHGDLMSRLTNDIDNISTTISQSSVQLMANVIMITGSFTLMLLLSPLLTVASVITVPLVFLLTGTVVKRTRVLFKGQQAQLGALNGHIEETISGIQVVKAFNHEESTIEQFGNINTKLCDIGIKAQIWSGFMMPLMNVINNIGFAAVAGVGGLLAVRDMITIGVIASFLSYSRQFARPLNDTANIFNVLQTAIAGAERVFEILDQDEEPIDTPNAIELENPKGHVVFEDVTFEYRPGVPILKNISFEARAGSNTALVGPTGAGKTTIVNLLTRFYDVSGGRISIDGRDIREYTRSSFRSCFGIVLQDTYLFTGTIRENIKYGRLDASDEEMEKAAAMANADGFINRLPKGYDTMLSESGGNLSQGQRQLLAIARAILADPAILILDEATSSVDTRTELRIQEAMLKLMKGRTSFIIAHRLSTIKDADTIMVIDKGEIVEKGSHEELIKAEGFYRNLYFSQFKNITEE